MASPLLSRFDLVFVLKDSRNNDWDNLVADFILNDFVDDDTEDTGWDLQMLQVIYVIPFNYAYLLLIYFRHIRYTLKKYIRH